MTMMHVDYPKKRGFFFWDELECLARALGFKKDLFSANLPEDFEAHDDGLSLKSLIYLITEHKCYNQALDRTVNIHTDEWNLHVIHKAATLSNSHVLTFSELHAIRVAYQLYEQLDTKGMPLEEGRLQRAIKMCGRMISPMKMLQRLKHMKPLFEEEDRIQLHEFLDLILWCDVYESMAAQFPACDNSKEEGEMYKMIDFKKLLSHYDQLLSERLNKKYLDEEQTFSKIQHGSRQMPKDVPPVDSEFRRRQVAYHNRHYKPLHSEVGRSQQLVHVAAAGYVRQRPVSAPDPSMLEEARTSKFTGGGEYGGGEGGGGGGVGRGAGGRRGTVGSCREYGGGDRTVMDIAGKWIRRTDKKRDKRKDVNPAPPPPPPPVPSPYVRPHTAPVLTELERTNRDNYMEALCYEISTMDNKYQRLLEDDIDYLLPGFREWRENNPKQPPPTPPAPRTPRKQIPSEETLKRLCYQRYRGPTPAHSKSCDARYRGWHKVRVRRGSHYVLTRPAFEQSDKGRLIDKMRHVTRDISGQTPFAHRHTRDHQIQPERPRPAHVPEDMLPRKRQLRLKSQPPAHRAWTPSPQRSDRLTEASQSSASQGSFPKHSGSMEEVTEVVKEEVKEEVKEVEDDVYYGNNDLEEVNNELEKVISRSNNPVSVKYDKMNGISEEKDVESDKDVESESESESYDEEESESVTERSESVTKQKQTTKQSESSSETIDFNFVTANLKNIQTKNRFLLPPSLVYPQDPFVKPPSYEKAVRFPPSPVESSTESEVEESDYESDESEPEEIKSSSTKGRASESTSSSQRAKNSSSSHSDSTKKSRVVALGKMGKVSVLEEIRERDETTVTPLVPLEESDDEDKEVDENHVKETENLGDIESSASKLWPKLPPPSEDVQTPRENLLNGLEEKKVEKDPDTKSQGSRASACLSDLSASLNIRVNPHPAAVRALSARSQRSGRAESSLGSVVLTPKDYPEPGKKGIVLLDVPPEWEAHPWIMDMLNEDLNEKKTKKKTFRRLIKRGEGQISPKLKRRFATSAVFDCSAR